jgi:hypothetical protein
MDNQVKAIEHGKSRSIVQDGIRDGKDMGLLERDIAGFANVGSGTNVIERERSGHLMRLEGVLVDSHEKEREGVRNFGLAS